jgi:hypothetical protein
MAEPPPLRSAFESAPGDGPAPSPDGAAALAAPDASPEVPWDAELLKPLVQEAIDAAEQSRINGIKEDAEKAKLGADLVKEICRDARYLPAFKSTAGTTGPRAIAKVLNRAGVSGKYSDEGLFALAIVALWIQGRRVRGKLDTLIADSKQPAEEKKS